MTGFRILTEYMSGYPEALEGVGECLASIHAQ